MTIDPQGLLSTASTSVADVSASLEPWATASRDPHTRWDVRGELGWGGMGRVLLAWDRWLGREVAIKEPTQHGDTARFEREALITARLEHPGIVPIFDIGMTPDGRPWFAMRVVRGQSLAAVLEGAASTRERGKLLRFLLTACEAVAYAHDRGVVHRDLKPANIMIGAFGESQVIDWGLALAPGFADQPTSVAGTPRYMSPEQARGEPLGPASDVFSLGAILFELVAGRRAFDQGQPDEVLAALCKGHVPSLRELAPEAAPELRAIVSRALSPAPADRYPTAKALADDLTRFLDGRRVSAHAYSTLALLGRVVRQWRAPLLVAALALIVLTVIGVAAFVRVGAERDSAEERLAVSLTVAAEGAARSGTRAEAEVLAANALARAPLASARGLLAALAGPRPTRVALGAVPCRPLDIAGERTLCRTDTGVAVVERGALLWDVPARLERGAVFIDHGRAVLVSNSLMLLDTRTGVPLDAKLESGCGGFVRPSGDYVSAVDISGSCASILSLAGTTAIGRGHCGGANVGALAVHPDGVRWALLCHNGELVLGRSDDARSERFAAMPDDLADKGSSLSFVPGSPALLIGTMTGLVLRFDTTSRTRKQVAEGGGLVHRIEVDASGTRALIVRDYGAPDVLELASLESLGRLPDWRQSAFRIDRDGTILAAGRTLVRWDFAAVRPNRLTFDGGIAALAVSADGSRLGVTHGPWLALVDPLGRRRLGERRWQDGLVKDVAFAPDGRSLSAHGLAELTARRFASDDGLPPTATRTTSLLRRLVVLADGSLLGSSYRDGLVLYRDASEPVVIVAQSMRDLVASSDGRRVATLGDDRQVYFASDLHRGGTLSRCGEALDGRALAIDPRSDTVFVARADAIEVACGDRGAEPLYRADVGELQSLALSDTWIAAGVGEGAVLLWRRGRPEVFALNRSHDARAAAIVIDPRERWLASGGWDGVVTLLTLPPPERVDARAVEDAWDLDLPAAFGPGATSSEWLR